MLYSTSRYDLPPRNGEFQLTRCSEHVALEKDKDSDSDRSDRSQTIADLISQLAPVARVIIDCKHDRVLRKVYTPLPFRSTSV